MGDINLFVPRFDVEACLTEIRECLERGWTGLGFKTVEFERAWCNFTGLPHGHFLNSATAGLHLAVKILKARLGWADGDEIITTPFTFVSTNHAILYEGLRPVFADIDDHLCLDPQSIAERIGPRTRAVIFVGHGGSTGQWQAVVDLCRARGLVLILDAAHQTGTRFRGRTPAADADVSIFSFQAVKNLPTADAGMICFAAAEDDAAARRLAWLGIDKDTFQRTIGQGAYKWRYEVDEVGYKYHGNSIMAAIGLVQLRHVEADNAWRRAISAVYDRELAGIDGIGLIPDAPDCVSSRHLYQVRVRQRDDAILYLNERRIFPGVHYRDNTLYKVYDFAAHSCSRASAASGEILSLPLHLGVSEEDAVFVARNLIDFVRSGAGGTR